MKSFFQTDAWGKFKEKSGWQSKKYDGLLGLKRDLPLGQSILYFPELSVDGATGGAIKKLIGSLDLTKQTFVRLEFLAPWQPDLAASLLEIGLVKSFEEVQPEHRQWVDLTPSEEKILTAMKPKGRYNIKIAQKHSLKIERGISPALVRRFFRLYQNTSNRQRFSGRDEDYFQQLVKVLAQERVGEVILVKKGSQDLAAGIFLYFDRIGSYLYGGSGGDRSLMAPYLMHWEAIKTAKQKGLKIYDLLAVAPPDQPDHPYAGLTRFKTQFGGETVRLLGSWDLVCKPVWYQLYRMTEKRRRKTIR